MRTNKISMLSRPISPLTLAMTSALLLSAASTHLSAAPCTTVGSPILVTEATGTDEVSGSLPWAMLQANNNADCSQIEFASNVTAITLTSTLSPTYDVNIVGHGDHLPSISRPSVYTAISNDALDLYIENITISGSGKGIYMGGVGTLDINDVIFEGNSTAIDLLASTSTTINNSTFDNNVTGVDGFDSGYNPSTTISGSTFKNHNGSAINFSLKTAGNILTIVDSVFKGNTNGAVEIDNSSEGSSISIKNSNFEENSNTSESSGSAGAVYIQVTGGDLSLDIQNTSFVDNETSWGTGGLMVDSSYHSTDITITQSTFSGNSGNSGGAIKFNNDTETATHTLDIVSSTIYDNSTNGDGGGVYVNTLTADTEVNISHTVIANNYANESHPNLVINGLSGSVIASLEYSWIGETSATATINNFSELNADDSTDLLSPLANNGALGLTHMPSEGSPLIDAGDPEADPENDKDQNGLERISNGTIDIGATEIQVPSDDDEEEDDTPKKKKSSSGSFTWFLAPLALLGVRRKRKRV